MYLSEYLLWNGLCPQCLYVENSDSRMRLNQNDFYECTHCRLQIATSFSGVQAVVLKQRGKGMFLKKESFADNNMREEIFTKQNKEWFPFGDKDLLQSKEKLTEYLQQIA